MDPRRLAALPALTMLALAAACAGPAVPAPIEGVPLCADYEQSGAKMRGGLHFPVRLRVLDGKNVLFKMNIVGRRSETELPPRTLIADDNAKYQVEWAQCGNEWAPRADRDAAHDTAKAREKKPENEASAYDCGETTVYKTDVLETKKGDRSSHTIKFEPPPNAACWTPLAAKAPPPPPAPTAAADAGAPSDAGAASEGDAGPATDAGPAQK